MQSLAAFCGSGRILRVSAFVACVSHASLAMNVRSEPVFGIGLQVRLLLFVLWTLRADSRLLNLKDDNA